MTSSDLLLPLRIPEIGPSLGKLVVAAPEGDASEVLSAARYTLVTKMIEWCRRGPPHARVDSVEVIDEGAQGEAPPFRVRY